MCTGVLEGQYAGGQGLLGGLLVLAAPHWQRGRRHVPDALDRGPVVLDAVDVHRGRRLVRAELADVLHSLRRARRGLVYLPRPISGAIWRRARVLHVGGVHHWGRGFLGSLQQSTPSFYSQRLRSMHCA